MRRAWEALGAADVPFTLDDRAAGWLAVADADQLDQVLWALLDNAVKYGGRAPVAVEVVADPAASRLRLTIADGGPGVPEDDRARLFGRFDRGTGAHRRRGQRPGPVRLARALPGHGRRPVPGAAGRLAGGLGAAFSIHLPAESAEEG